jgi:hypothetical protein
MGLKCIRVFCACEIVGVFYVVFCEVRALRKFEFRHVINETPNKW